MAPNINHHGVDFELIIKLFHILASQNKKYIQNGQNFTSWPFQAKMLAGEKFV